MLESELLVVIAIILVIMTLAIPAFNAIRGDGGFARVGYDIAGALDVARAYATANNTYAWVGFFEEDPGASSFPRTPGTGRIVVSAVASKDGTRVYSATSSNPTTPLDTIPSALTPLGKLMKFENSHLERLKAEALVRPSDPPDQYHVGHDDFANRPQFAGSSIMVPNAVTFSYPLGSTGGATQYKFTKIIQFSPLGEATKIVDTPVRMMEIGLRLTHGAVPDTKNPNVVAIQIAGVTGKVDIYRK